MPTFNFELNTIPLEKFDMGGVLYHANYFHLYEQAREEFLRQAGLPYSTLVKNSEHLAIVESHQKFLAPIYYGDKVELRLSFSELSKTTAKFNYQLFIENTLVHEAWTKNVLVSISSGVFKPSRLPGLLIEAINKFTFDN